MVQQAWQGPIALHQWQPCHEGGRARVRSLVQSLVQGLVQSLVQSLVQGLRGIGACAMLLPRACGQGACTRVAAAHPIPPPLQNPRAQTHPPHLHRALPHCVPCPSMVKPAP